MGLQNETQKETAEPKEVEIIECLEFKSADIRSIVKSDQLYHALRYLQTRLETDHGNYLHICRAKNAIVIKGWYIISRHVDLCVNACLYIVENNCDSIDNAIYKCQESCKKFIEPYSHIVLVENYRRLIYELTHYKVEFNAKYRDNAFEITIKF